MVEIISFIYRYSGLITVILSWLLLLTPFFFYRKKYNLKLISEVSEMDGGNKNIVNIGVYSTSITQFLFALFLINFNWGILVKTGGLSMFAGSLLFFIAGYVNIHKDRKIHTTLVNYYARFLLLSLMLISIGIMKYHPINILLLGLIIIAALVSMSLYKANTRWQAEVLIVFITNIWALLFYAFIL